MGRGTRRRQNLYTSAFLAASVVTAAFTMWLSYHRPIRPPAQEVRAPADPTYKTPTVYKLPEPLPKDVSLSDLEITTATLAER